MSYRTREKKRKARCAQALVNGNQRKHPDRWYLTIATRNCACNGCGGSLRRGAECIFRYEPKEIICRPCADKRGVVLPPSATWEKVKKPRRRVRKGRKLDV